MNLRHAKPIVAAQSASTAVLLSGRFARMMRLGAYSGVEPVYWVLQSRRGRIMNPHGYAESAD